MKKVLSLLICIVLLVSVASSAYAEWPDASREFTLVAGYNPGGATDAICRTAAPFLEKYLGIPVVVQNIPGSGGLVGTNSVFAAKADGYTAIYTATTDGIWAYKYLSPTEVPWEISDWKSTGVFASMQTMGFVCTKDKDWQDFGDFIEYVRTQPEGSVTVATLGPGRLDDLWAIELQEMLGVKFNWVLYEGSAAIQTDLLTGDIAAGCIGVARDDFLDHPNFRVLLGLTDEYPEGCAYRGVYPTLLDFQERLGYKYEDLTSLSIPPVLSFIVKANIPDEAYEKLCEAIKQMCADPEYQEAMKKLSWPTYISPEDAQETFDVIESTIASYVPLHKQYIAR